MFWKNLQVLVNVAKAFRRCKHEIASPVSKSLRNGIADHWKTLENGNCSVNRETRTRRAHVSTALFSLLVPTATRPRNEWRVLACGTAMSISVSTASSPYRCRRPRRRRRRPPRHRRVLAAFTYWAAFILSLLLICNCTYLELFAFLPRCSLCTPIFLYLLFCWC